MPQTVIPIIGQQEWTSRSFALYPDGWLSDEAMTNGGVMWALFNAFSEELEFNNQQLEYAWLTTRLASAIDLGLDAWGRDLYDSEKPLVRLAGESDADYRTRLQRWLYVPGGTRQAVSEIITRLIGTPPRLSEPWNPMQTCAWDVLSFWDVDHLNNPFCWGDPARRYTGYVQSDLPPYQAAGRIDMMDVGWFWDTGYANYHELDKDWIAVRMLMDHWLLEAKQFGTVLLRKFLPADALSISGSAVPVSTHYAFIGEEEEGSFTVPGPTLSFPFCVLAQASWLTDLSINPFSSHHVPIRFGVPAETFGVLSVAYIPIVNDGALLVPVAEGAESVTIPLPAGFGTSNQPIARPTWNSSLWLESFTSSEMVFRFSTAAPETAGLSLYLFPVSSSGEFEPSEGSEGDILTIPYTETYEAFLIPSWNTTVALEASSADSLVVSYGTPAPADAILRWGLL